MTEALSVTAVLDASVLYPALLRNMLMRLALHGLFRARWSERIHDEWIAALLRNRLDLTRARVERTRNLMDSHIQDALVAGYESRIESVTLPDADDRHVLAAAILATSSPPRFSPRPRRRDSLWRQCHRHHESTRFPEFSSCRFRT
jgi:hypothetical protein